MKSSSRSFQSLVPPKEDIRYIWWVGEEGGHWVGTRNNIRVYSYMWETHSCSGHTDAKSVFGMISVIYFYLEQKSNTDIGDKSPDSC